jgi:DNA repair photolyase
MLMLMRWDSLLASGDGPGPETSAGCRPAQLSLFDGRMVARTFDTPGFAGMTFYEVYAKSVINKVPEASRVPFRWTINPYRGCSHSCVYCFARKTHTYLDFDAGHDFNSRIVVKVNAPQLARRELAAPRWQREHVAMGTNVDCYQRAEGRYRLMPGIIAALRDASNPFSILTKGTLILRDLDLLTEAAAVTDVGLNVSVGFVDKEISRSIEPGTPTPERRLGVCSALTDRGLPCGVLMGPVLPFLTDSPAQLEATVRLAAQAGATRVSPIVLHLRAGAREWFMQWLTATHPDLVGRYRQLYRGGSYAPKDYQQQVATQVAEFAARHRIGQSGPRAARRIRPVSPQPPAAGPAPAQAPAAVQLPLL